MWEVKNKRRTGVNMTSVPDYWGIDKTTHNVTDVAHYYKYQVEGTLKHGSLLCGPCRGSG